jgi:hypothetical protein
MALPNLSGSNIQDTFQRVVHTDGTILYDGTGSVVLDATELAELQTLGANNVGWEYLATVDQRLSMGSPVIFGHITSSGEISASGNIYASELYVHSARVRFNNDVLEVANKGIHSVGSITSSADISSSGDLFFNSISGGTF